MGSQGRGAAESQVSELSYWMMEMPLTRMGKIGRSQAPFCLSIWNCVLPEPAVPLALEGGPSPACRGQPRPVNTQTWWCV